MCQISRSMCITLVGALIFTSFTRTVSLKVLRNSGGHNHTYVPYETVLYLQADNESSGALLRLGGSNITPTTLASPPEASRKDRGNLTLAVPIISLRQASSLSMDPKIITRTALFLLITVLCVALFLGYYEKTSEESNSNDLSRQSSLGNFSEHDYRRISDHDFKIPASLTTEKIPASLTTEGHHGDWSKKYSRAERPREKQALELLFKCNIIPMQEFLHADVSQAHIDECIWIANEMLKQKTIQEWMDSGAFARDTFNSCVTALYEARVDIKDAQKYDSPQSRYSASPAKPPEESANDTAVIDPRNRIALLDRCRQIMAETHRERQIDGGQRRESRESAARTTPTNLSPRADVGMGHSNSLTPRIECEKQPEPT